MQIKQLQVNKAASKHLKDKISYPQISAISSKLFTFFSVSKSANHAAIALAAVSASATTACNYMRYSPACIFHILNREE